MDLQKVMNEAVNEYGFHEVYRAMVTAANPPPVGGNDREDDVFDAASRQAAPVGAGGPDIANLVSGDIQRRAEIGEKRYGQRLRPFNGRSALRDLYDEILDAAMYARQLLVEEGH